MKTQQTVIYPIYKESGYALLIGESRAPVQQTPNTGRLPLADVRAQCLAAAERYAAAHNMRVAGLTYADITLEQPR